MNFADDDPEDGMCRNCISPWKCNGPHLNNLRDWVKYTVYLTRSKSTNGVIDGLVRFAQRDEIRTTREEVAGIFMQLMTEGQVAWSDTDGMFREWPAVAWHE